MEADKSSTRPRSTAARAAVEEKSFIVVGIGASAGGLHALQAFFDQMTTDSGMAFVVVSHLSPEHVSHLAGLLQSHTAMPVVEVSEIVKLENNHVYVIPPNRYLSAIDSHLRLTGTEGRKRPHAPIDHFFRSLAEAHGENGVAIILSGTGSDGSLGISKVKERGGLTIVQEPTEAEFDGMPQSAIATGTVDFVLPVAQIASRLAQYAESSPHLPVNGDGEPANERAQDIIQKVLAQLRGQTGHDFSRYKVSTFTRRLRRRMQIQRVDELADYFQQLVTNRNEIQALFKDLLITVTHFFRDPDAFAALEKEVMPRLLTDKAAGDQLRVWVVGCATGEEAYSIAILLLELTSQFDSPPTIQIFASDISDDALLRAREGFYPESIAADVSPVRLERFFSRESGGYRVKREVRECVLFAPHNFLKDAPFSRLDLISCRNLLIYLERDAQRQLFELFHYALRPSRFLFLGPSESVDGSKLFRVINKRHSLYQRLPSAEVRLPTLPLVLPGPRPRQASPGERTEAAGAGTIHREMLERNAQPSILVNAEYEMAHLSPLAGRYVQQPGGEPTNNILRSVLPPFRVELTTLLYSAFKKSQDVRSQPIQAIVDGRPLLVTLAVYPAKDEHLDGFALVVFEENRDPARLQPAARDSAGADSTATALLEELEHSKKRLQVTIEEFETSKEEMKASHEELQSINEELRSTAEELETSKEELQSMNEELITLNQENRNKIDELNQLNSDLQNLMASTEIATLFLDRELRIRRFTPRTSELFNILPTDRGRPLAHLTHKLGSADLLADAGNVLRHLIPIEREIAGENNAYYLARFLPYRSLEDHIDGVVINFVAISELKQAQQELERHGRQQAAIVLLGRLALEGEGLTALFEEAIRQVHQTLAIESVEIWQRPPGDPDDDAPAGTISVTIPGRHPYGLLIARPSQARPFPEDDLTFLQAIANLLGVAIERKQAELLLQGLNDSLEVRVEQRTGQTRSLASELLLTEQRVRQRISQLLHDDLQQILFATQVHVQLLDKEMAGGNPGVQEVKEMIDEALQLTRRLTIDLSPPVLRSQNLEASLRWLAGYMNDLHGLRVELNLESIPAEPGADMHLLLFQIVKELLFNVVKHAQVNQAQVQLRMDNGNLLLLVIDQGRGFNAPAVMDDSFYESSYGLRNMRERLGLFGGRMEITSRARRGTTVTIMLPQPSEVPAELSEPSEG